MMSGTVSNQAGLRALLTQPPYSVLCDSRGRVNPYEASEIASLTGASIQLVEASTGRCLTLEDVQDKIVVDEHVQSSPIPDIAPENAVNGLIMPLYKVRKVVSLARKHGVKIHLDGARLYTLLFLLLNHYRNLFFDLSEHIVDISNRNIRRGHTVDRESLRCHL